MECFCSSKLDAATLSFLDGFAKMFATLEKLPLPQQRAIIKEMFILPESQMEQVKQVKDEIVQGRHGPINVHLIYPNAEGSLPILVFLHRGGWAYGSIQECEVLCRRLANVTECIVAIVDYRLSPENKFPIPLEDCYDASLWVAEHAHTLSGDPSKIILCGESAGGNMATAVALMARDSKQFTAKGQLLLYPCLESNLVKKYYDASPDKSLLSYDNMKFFWDMYLSSPEDGNNPLASPTKCDDLANLPPCFILSAEHDALKHEDDAYAAALKKAGVTVTAKTYRGVIHGFLDLPLADATKAEAIQDIATWIKQL